MNGPLRGKPQPCPRALPGNHEGQARLRRGTGARLAVDQRLRGLGIGEALVNLCLGITQEYIAPNVGCRFVMVDSKRDAVNFYDRMGFTMLDTPANREREEPVMFIDLSKL